MKKEVVMGIIILVFVALFIFIIGLSYKTKNNFTKSTGINNTKVITVSEVAKHNSQSDCYLIINSKVYNVTTYINSHPGGLIIVNYCGQEATQAFNTKGGRGRGHSDYANQLLNNYFVADLK